MHASRLESEYKKVGGYNAVEIAYNKRVGEDRTEGSGAVILDEEMLRDVQVRVHTRGSCCGRFAMTSPFTIEQRRQSVSIWLWYA